MSSIAKKRATGEYKHSDDHAWLVRIIFTGVTKRSGQRTENDRLLSSLMIQPIFGNPIAGNSSNTSPINQQAPRCTLSAWQLQLEEVVSQKTGVGPLSQIIGFGFKRTPLELRLTSAFKSLAKLTRWTHLRGAQDVQNDLTCFLLRGPTRNRAFQEQIR
jgi:hypothetical protein